MQHAKILNAATSGQDIFNALAEHGQEVTDQGLIAQVPSIQEYGSDEYYGGDSITILDSTQQLVHCNKLVSILQESNPANSIESTCAILNQKNTDDPLSSGKKLIIAHSMRLVYADTIELNKLAAEYTKIFNSDVARQDVFNVIVQHGVQVTNQGLIVKVPSMIEIYFDEHCGQNNLTLFSSI